MYIYLIIEEDLRESLQKAILLRTPCGDHVRDFFSLYSMPKALLHALNFLFSGSPSRSQHYHVFRILPILSLPLSPNQHPPNRGGNGLELVNQILFISQSLNINEKRESHWIIVKKKKRNTLICHI